MQKTPKSSLTKTISDFVSVNSFVLLIIIAAVAFHQIVIVGGTVSELEENQNKMVKYLKENVSKVHYLTASGMLLTTKKSPISLSDDRFKSYVANNITDAFIAGLVRLSKNYKITYPKAEDIVLKNENIKRFFDAFIKPQGSAIASSIRTIHRAILDKKYPEYIELISFNYPKWLVRKPSEVTNYEKVVDGTLKVTVVVKSWIAELKKWHTVEKEIRIPFSLIVNVDKYAKLDNPFGIHFTKLGVPAIWKPSATQVREEQIK